jgi:hypothetical protein
MIRRLIAAAALFAVTLTAFAADAHAGCQSRGHGFGYGYGGHRVNYVRPVTVVNHVPHVQHVQHIVRPQIQIAPAVIDAQPEFPTVPAGSTLTLPANFLGPQPGSVFMVFDSIKLPVQISQWTENGVTITLPPMAIRDTVLIRLDIVLPHGQVGHTQKLYVTPPAPVVLHPTAPQSPLPTNDALQAQSSPNFGGLSIE